MDLGLTLRMKELPWLLGSMENLAVASLVELASSGDRG